MARNNLQPLTQSSTKHQNMAPAYLLWSKGFLRSLAAEVALVAFASYAVSRSQTLSNALADAEYSLRLRLLQQAHGRSSIFFFYPCLEENETLARPSRIRPCAFAKGLAWWSAVGLLSSSCCLIQVSRHPITR